MPIQFEVRTQRQVGTVAAHVTQDLVDKGELESRRQADEHLPILPGPNALIVRTDRVEARFAEHGRCHRAVTSLERRIKESGPLEADPAGVVLPWQILDRLAVVV